MAQTKAERSAAAKKAAATRKKNAKATERGVEARKARAMQATAEDVASMEEPQQAEGLSEYRPKHKALQAAGLDQQAAHKVREAERQAERDRHLALTGDVSRGLVRKSRGIPRKGRKN